MHGDNLAIETQCDWGVPSLNNTDSPLRDRILGREHAKGHTGHTHRAQDVMPPQEQEQQKQKQKPRFQNRGLYTLDMTVTKGTFHDHSYQAVRLGERKSHITTPLPHEYIKYEKTCLLCSVCVYVCIVCVVCVLLLFGFIFYIYAEWSPSLSL